MATTTTATETNEIPTAVPHPSIPGVYTQDESVGAANTYTPTASEQAEFDSIFKQLQDWGTVGDKVASENMLMAGAIALINRANSNAHQYKQYNRCMDYDTLVSDIKALKGKNQAEIQQRTSGS